MKKGIVIVLSPPKDEKDDGFKLVPVESKSMLQTMYEKIGCGLVQAVQLNKTTDLICDEEGFYKGYDFGIKLDVAGLGETQPILGKSVIVKNVNGSWTPFADETEAIEFMYENVYKIFHLKMTNND